MAFGTMKPPTDDPLPGVEAGTHPSAPGTSAETLPDPLSRLVGQHPAALRLVRWPETAVAAHLEIETKHGLVVLIDCDDGTVRAQPPIPPGVDAGARTQEDLTMVVPDAFDDRPVFRAIDALRDHGRLTGWRFELSTGAVITISPGAAMPVASRPAGQAR